MTLCTELRRTLRLVALPIVLATFGPLPSAVAAIVAVGAVTPNPITTTGTTLIVGDDQSPVEDTRAWVTVNGVTAVQYGSLIVGDEEEFYGELHVEADFINNLNARLTLTAQGSSSAPTVQIGHEGTGRLTMKGGATLTVAHTSGDMAIGVETTGVGYVEVRDPFTQITVEDNLLIGQNGTGYLNILDGAAVRTVDTGTSPAVTIGSSATAVGEVVVDGSNSLLYVASNLVVGGSGQGRLVVGQGARVDVNNWSGAAVTIGPAGRLEMAGGTLLGNTPTTGVGTTVNGYLGGSGLVRGSVAVGENGVLEVGDNDWLRFDGNVSNQGAITVDRGELQFFAGLTNNAIGAFSAPGRISLQNGGTLRLAQTLVNDGVLANAHGTTNIHGEITNQNAIVVARDTVATFHDAVNNTTGTITVEPGGNALFLADVMFVSMSSLALGLSTDDLGDSSARLAAAGVASLGGTLKLSFDGFTPQAGQSFELISANGGIVGAFDSVEMPLLPNDVQAGVMYSQNRVMVEFTIDDTSNGLPGDYNGDGQVDAGDYVRWRNHLGDANEAGINHNGDGGGVTVSDYTWWKQHYGTAGAGGGGLGPDTSPTTNQGVPEPAAPMTIAVVIAAAACFRRSRR